jgi:hypothetical protein
LNAWNIIQKSIKKVSGKPYCVSCTYKISSDRPISSSTKISYVDYHKKTEKFHQVFNISKQNTVDRLVQIVYKPQHNDNVLAVVHKDPKNPGRKLATQKIELDELRA